MSSPFENRLSDIYTQIQENVSRVHFNQFQCQRLSARINQLIDPLERLEHATSIYLRQETRPILDNFLQYLDDCNSFIEKFLSPTYICEETNEQQTADHKIFEELNQRLSQFGQDLCLGIDIEDIFDRKQNQIDLIEKTNQIIEQQHTIDRIISQRFQSLRKYLDRKETTQTKTFIDSKNHFLHIPLKDLHIKEKPIGSGGFADVYKGIWLTQHDKIAIKVLHLNHLSDDFYQEISIMYQIRYEHIVTFLGACIEPNFYAMIFEYMPLGSLYDVLHGTNEIIILTWLDRYSLGWQIAKSINYLHNHNPCIIHRDIKSMNFLLKYSGSSQHRFLLKVCDFGLAEIRRECLLQSTTFERVGSFAWKAPELLISDEKHTKESDVFSLGMTMWELATGKKPWDEQIDESIIGVLVKIEERPKIPEDIPKEFKQAIEDAWNQDPLKRPSCFHLMERMCKQIKNELVTLTEDSYCQSTTNPDSTKTAVSVVEEEDRRYTKTLSSVIISDCRASEEESLPIDKQSMPIKSEIVSINPPLQRSLSKSAEDVSSNNVQSSEYSTRGSLLSRSSINLRRSIIGRTILSSDDNNQTNGTRSQTIIEQDIDSLLDVYRF